MMLNSVIISSMQLKIKDFAGVMFKTMKMWVPYSSPAAFPDATTYHYNSNVGTRLW